MKVQDIIDLAVAGDIRQLSVAKVKPSDQNRDENIAALIGFINLGIVELYGRFGLAHQSTTIENVVDGAQYTMSEDYLWLINATAIYDNDPDYEPDIRINDENADIAVMTPAPFTVVVKKDDDIYSDINSIYLTYLTTPPWLTSVNDTVLLPKQFFEPLLFYIASKAHGGLPNGENSDNTSKYWGRFEAACARIIQRGGVTDDVGNTWKFDSRGYK